MYSMMTIIFCVFLLCSGCFLFSYSYCFVLVFHFLLVNYFISVFENLPKQIVFMFIIVLVYDNNPGLFL